jgi:hypothetical protein
VRIILVCVTLLLAGCGSASPIALPGGGAGYMIGCGGIQNTMDTCLVKASQVCPAGYDVVATDQESVPFINPYQRSMYVRCR